MTLSIDDLDTFERAYLECALWSSTDQIDDSGGEPLDANYTIEDIHPASLASMLEDCRDFRNAQEQLLVNLDAAQCGHDFWLTRNGHGAGFWDRGHGKVGELLTEACKPYGSCDLYVGDDDLIHCL